jgi:hypothetical protein
MRRVQLLLTEAQAAWLRGAILSHAEDMAVAGLEHPAEPRMIHDIMQQLSKPAKTLKSKTLKEATHEPG